MHGQIGQPPDTVYSRSRSTRVKSSHKNSINIRIIRIIIATEFVISLKGFETGTVHVEQLINCMHGQIGQIDLVLPG